MKTAECLQARRPEGGQPCGGRGGSQAAGSAPMGERRRKRRRAERAGTGAPPAGSSPCTRQGCLCHGAAGRGCGWLPHEQAGEDWGWAGVVHRDREGCLHTSLSTSGVQKAGGPGLLDTSSALADSRQIQRPRHLEQQVRTSSWSPEGSQLSALTTSHGGLSTQSTQHLHPGTSETHCPAHSDAHGAAPGQAQVGPGDKALHPQIHSRRSPFPPPNVPRASVGGAAGRGQ